MRSSRGASRPSGYGRAASRRAARSPTTSPRAAAPAIAASSFTLCQPTEVFRGEGKMGLLIAKILFLLVLAAACGALFAYWWFRRHYEDVTLEYSRSREEWSAWRRGFEERLAARPEVDLRPLTEELTALSEQLTALDDSMRPNLAAVEKRLTAIEHALFPVQTRLDELEGAVRAFSLTPVLERLGTLASRLERSEEHTSELQSRGHLVCRLLLEKKKKTYAIL